MSLVKTFTYAIGAGATKTLPGGRYLYLLKADAAVDVEFFDENGQPLGKAEGVLGGFELGINPKDLGFTSALVGFGKVQITSATAQTVEVAVARQKVSYNRISGTITSTASVGATATQSSATVGAASGVLLAANANRQRAYIRNTHATDRLHFCDDGTAALTSHPYIGPGEEILFQSEDGLNSIRGGANDITALIREERD